MPKIRVRMTALRCTVIVQREVNGQDVSKVSTIQRSATVGLGQQDWQILLTRGNGPRHKGLEGLFSGGATKSHATTINMPLGMSIPIVNGRPKLKQIPGLPKRGRQSTCHFRISICQTAKKDTIRLPALTHLPPPRCLISSSTAHVNLIIDVQ